MSTVCWMPSSLALQGYIITGKDDTGLTVRKADNYDTYIHIAAEEIPG